MANVHFSISERLSGQFAPRLIISSCCQERTKKYKLWLFWRTCDVYRPLLLKRKESKDSLYFVYCVLCYCLHVLQGRKCNVISLFCACACVCATERERERAYTLESAGGQWFVFLFIRFECLLKVSYLSLPAIVSRVFLLQRSTSPQSGMHAVTKDRRE